MMAFVFTAAVAWSPSIFDFHTLLTGAAGVITPDTGGSFNRSYSLYGTTYSVPVAFLSVDSSFKQTSGGINTSLAGIGLAGTTTLNVGDVTGITQFTDPAGALIAAVLGTHVSASDITLTATTLGTADDFALIRSTLTSNDFAELSKFNDSFDARSGKDLVFGNDGNDVILLGIGRDVGIGGLGRDSVDGGGGKDELVGNGGSDFLTGGSNGDLLDGGKGNDRMNGGAGADIFTFARADGQDVIEDYHQGVDQIDIRSGAATFGQLQLTQSGTDAIITFATTQITLTGVQASSLQAGDFSFNNNTSNAWLEAFVVGWDFIA